MPQNYSKTTHMKTESAEETLSHHAVKAKSFTVQKAKSNTKATILGSFFQSLDLDSRLGGCGIRGIDYLFFESIRRVSKEDSRLI
jgi:hypothetical protein